MTTHVKTKLAVFVAGGVVFAAAFFLFLQFSQIKGIEIEEKLLQENINRGLEHIARQDAAKTVMAAYQLCQLRHASAKQKTADNLNVEPENVDRFMSQNDKTIWGGDGRVFAIKAGINPPAKNSLSAGDARLARSGQWAEKFSDSVKALIIERAKGLGYLNIKDHVMFLDTPLSTVPQTPAVPIAVMYFKPWDCVIAAVADTNGFGNIYKQTDNSEKRIHDIFGSTISHMLIAAGMLTAVFAIISLAVVGGIFTRPEKCESLSKESSETGQALIKTWRALESNTKQVEIKPGPNKGLTAPLHSWTRQTRG